MTPIKDLEGLTLLLTKLVALKPSKPLLKGFVKPSQNHEVKHEKLPTKCIEQGFDPNAYKLFVKASFDQWNLHMLGKYPISIAKEDRKGLSKPKIC